MLTVPDGVAGKVCSANFGGRMTPAESQHVRSLVGRYGVEEKCGMERMNKIHHMISPSCSCGIAAHHFYAYVEKASGCDHWGPMSSDGFKKFLERTVQA